MAAKDPTDQRPWSAKWVWLENERPEPIQRCWFRRDFSLSRTGHIKLNLSADSRYRLWLDREVIGVGPPAGDLQHYHYDRFGFDPSLTLRPGAHQLIVEVVSYGSNGPFNEVHARGGFIAEGSVVDDEQNVLCDLATPGDWRVMDDPAYAGRTDGGAISDTGIATPFGYSLGFAETIDLRRQPVCPFASSTSEPVWGLACAIVGVARMPWTLVPASVPQPELTPQAFARVVRCAGSATLSQWEDLIAGHADLTIPAHSCARVVVDQEELTTAYPRLAFRGGYGTYVRMVYAEAFSRAWQKDIRDQAEGMHIEGYSDELWSSGRDTVYMPMRWQTFRFIELLIQTGEHALTLTGFDSIFHAYPLERRSVFACDHPLAEPLWEMSWRTLRLCSQEHFTDCPYYEQLQYMGDGLIQALLAFYLGGDTVLWRRMLIDMAHSRLPSGLTQSRYPSRIVQIIPTFSLLWVRAVQQYDQHVGDPGLVQELMPGMRDVVGWFMQRYDDGLFASPEEWQFVDWVPDWPQGDASKAVQTREGRCMPSAIVNLQLLDALQALVQMGPRAGLKPRDLEFYRSAAQDLQERIRSRFWSERHGLWADSTEHDRFSEHANCLAILTGTADDRQQALILQNLFGDGGADAARCTLYFQFYLANALTRTGQADRVWDRLDTWRWLFEKRLTTLPEYPDAAGNSSRSDCHAWSAWPAYWFLAGVLGVFPAEPGYAVIGIRPQLGALRWARGEVHTPHGPVRIDLREEAGRVTLTAATPAGVPCRILMPDGTATSHSGGHIHCGCDTMEMIPAEF